jgi:hypothetical protein
MVTSIDDYLTFEKRKKIKNLLVKSIKDNDLGRRVLKLYSKRSLIYKRYDENILLNNKLKLFIKEQDNYLGGLAESILTYREREMQLPQSIFEYKRPFGGAFLINERSQGSFKRFSAKDAGSYQLHIGKKAGLNQIRLDKNTCKYQKRIN